MIVGGEGLMKEAFRDCLRAVFVSVFRWHVTAYLLFPFP